MAASTALLALNDFLLHTARPGPLISPTGLIIDKRDEFHTIAARLEQNDVIDDRHAFTALAQLLSVEDKLKSGEYLFGPQSSALEVLDDLVAGRSVLGVVDLPNGATSSAIVALLNKVRILSGTVTIPPEGMLMPGNYKISRGMTRQNIIQLMMRLQADAVKEIWANRSPDLPIKTPHSRPASRPQQQPAQAGQ